MSSGIDALAGTRGSGVMWPSLRAMGRVPQPASARASANHGAKALERMQEYFVSVCFLDTTVPAPIYNVFVVQTQMKSPTFSVASRGKNEPEMTLACGDAARVFA